jgi:hypothetical protein
MSDPRNADEAKALAMAIFELARVICRETAGNRDDAAPAPEVVPA